MNPFLRLLFTFFFYITQANADQLQLFTFNVLAPVYANPIYYFPSTEPLLQKEIRREKIIGILNTVSETADIIALQEVSIDTLDLIDGCLYVKEGEYKYFQEALNDKYYGYHCSHEKTYWGKYYDYTHPHEYNAYVDTGVALFVRKSKFSHVDFQNIDLETGNHMILAEADAAEGKRIRVAVIHFDSDLRENRHTEFINALSHMKPEENVFNFMLGDFNATFEDGTLKEAFEDSIFADTMLVLEEMLSVKSINKRTRPFLDLSYNAPHIGPIDHVIYEKGKAVPVPTLWTHSANYGLPGDTINGVIDQRLFIRLPEIDGFDWNEEERVNQTMIELGSDHFPVISTVSY